MLTASPSPRLNHSPRSDSGASLSPQTRSRYDLVRKSSISGSPIVKPRSSHVDTSHQPTQAPPRWSRDTNSGSSASASIHPPQPSRRNMVDAGTQYSPPPGYCSSPPPRKIAIPEVAKIKLVESSSSHSSPIDTAMPTASPLPAQPTQATQPTQQSTLEQPDIRSQVSKRQSTTRPDTLPEPSTTQQQADGPDNVENANLDDQGPSKRPRGEVPPVKLMPIQYETCDTKELVLLISSMLMELIRYNDAIPLRDGALTRFHSRAPPGISVLDYLQRLTTHATLSPPILLSMVYYIDKLCALYPAFTISSLTVHRFLITSATVASKGLSDSFWTNKTYARVGGVSIKELATLELEFLGRVQWRIVPKPEILIDYYRSLVERSPGYELEPEIP